MFTTLSLDAYFTSRIETELSTQAREVDFVLRHTPAQVRLPAHSENPRIAR